MLSLWCSQHTTGLSGTHGVRHMWLAVPYSELPADANGNDGCCEPDDIIASAWAPDTLTKVVSNTLASESSLLLRLIRA